MSRTNSKSIFIFFCSIFLIFILLRSNLNQPHPQHHHPTTPIPTCNKLPPPLSQALLHYATSNTTPQQTLPEISITAQILTLKSPCNFLVFGLGHDSLMWAALNHGGRTIFLEEDGAWISHVREIFPFLESYHVRYDTRVRDAWDLMNASQGEDCRAVRDPRESECRLAHKGLPKEAYEVEWDVIMVDAPTGYHDDAPGRMSAIYTAGLLARYREEGETDVLVHDVYRKVEDRFSRVFLCDGYLMEEEGRLRHFTVPSHRTRAARSFCP